MKFLRPPFLKHLFVPRAHTCTRVYAASSARRRYHILPRIAREAVGERAGKEGLGSPQKLICNFNIPLFIPTKSVGGDLMKRRLRCSRATVWHYIVHKYRRNCLVTVDNATAADPEFVCRTPLNSRRIKARSRKRASVPVAEAPTLIIKNTFIKCISHLLPML